ncbi:MAG: flavin reductase [Candidatus Aenigmarchaeota archaeon]|nr:flavin reductase [Candidatus Aenigmarchaeota archaeon]MDW8149580.1 flavin reductase [Candidatus Aenigmarchaeota archaeon]
MDIKEILPKIQVLITTRDPLEGIDIYPTDNFLILSKSPFIVILAIKNNSRCYYNITKTKEFVVNVIPKIYEDLIEKCKKEYIRGINEIKEIGLNEEKCLRVKVPRIKEASLALECVWIGSVEVDSINLLENYPVFGKVVEVHGTKVSSE